MYKEIKNTRDKLKREIDGLKVLGAKTKDLSVRNNEIVKEKREKYTFYNNLLKAFN